jgi:hypothetical protein
MAASGLAALRDVLVSRACGGRGGLAPLVAFDE